MFTRSFWKCTDFISPAKKTTDLIRSLWANIRMGSCSSSCSCARKIATNTTCVDERDTAVQVTSQHTETSSNRHIFLIGFLCENNKQQHFLQVSFFLPGGWTEPFLPQLCCHIWKEILPFTSPHLSLCHHTSSSCNPAKGPLNCSPSPFPLSLSSCPHYWLLFKTP